MLRNYFNLPRPVHILCLGTFVNRAGTFLIPFLTLYLTSRLGLSERFATRTMGLYGAGAIVAGLIGGHLADWIGRRTVMLISLFGGACLMLVFSTVHQTPIIIANIACLGIIGELYRPGASAMIGDLTPPATRPHAFGLMYVSINLGFAIGPAVGGALAGRFGFPWLFRADAFTSAAYGLIVLLALRETLHLAHRQSQAAGETTRVSLRDAAAHIVRDRPFLTLCAGNILFAICFMQSMSTFPLYLAERGISTETYGRLIALNGVIIVALQLPVTHWMARYQRGSVIVAAALVTAVGIGLTGFASSVWQYAATVLIWTFGEIMQASCLFAIAADLAPPAMRGRYMGVFGMSYSLAMSLSAPIGGEILARFGGGYVWLGAFLSGCSSALLYLSIRAHIRAVQHAVTAPATPSG
ncbi:MAG TPA: MFS transporter [Phycisphaerae bacterium]|nr:MFS transporter [Phycisphaerae bacterium]